MEWRPVGSLTLKYGPDDELVEYDDSGGGQVYGILEGRLELGSLGGAVHLTNTAPRRTDGIFEPTLRGVWRLPDGARAFLRMDGISIPDPRRGKNHRIVLSTLRVRARHLADRTWNAAFLLHDGRGGPGEGGWQVVGPVLQAIPGER